MPASAAPWPAGVIDFDDIGEFVEQAATVEGVSDVFHLDLTRSQLQGASIAVLPGDPGRVPKLASLLDRPEPLAANREFTSYLGFAGDVPIIVCSTGIGGPSTSIAVEELAQLGVRTFLRAGTTGAIQPEIEIADVVITSGAVRMDGASLHFAPIEYPAVAHFDCTLALVDAARALGYPHHVGITAASDTFYPGQERYDTVSGYVLRSLKGSRAEWAELNVLNYEMESATLFTMCAANGWRAGMVAGVLVNRTEREIPDPETHDRVEAVAAAVVIEAARRLAG